MTKSYTQTCDNAREYTTSGRACAAAAKMFGRDGSTWWRVVNVHGDVHVIDTYSGYLAK